ncbi:MAG: phage virion morphogenesis protein [Thiomicrospira sp.]
MTISVTIDDKAARDALARLSGLDLAQMLRGVGEVLTNSTRERLAAGVDVQGKPFVPLSPLTQQLKKKNKTKPLIREGDLFRELSYQLVNGGRALEFGSDRKYAALQQFGGVVKPKTARALHLGGKVFAKQVVIPARPFIGFTAQDEQMILANIADHIEKQLNAK